MPLRGTCTVAVPDIARVRALLAESGLPVRETARGELFVPAEAALGAVLIFREICEGGMGALGSRRCSSLSGDVRAAWFRLDSAWCG